MYECCYFKVMFTIVKENIIMSLKEMNRESDIRRKIAEEVASKCPWNIGKEIIIVGSVSRGVADGNSDIEIEFLNENIPSEKERVEWIKQIGGTQITPYGASISDGSMWVIFKYKDYWIEAGWQSFKGMKENVESILNGEIIGHDRLLLPWVIMNAICITEGDLIKKLKEDLKVYPDILQKKIILSSLKGLTLTLALKVKKALAEREDKIPLLERLIVDVKRVLRILFALNKEWEPDWKRIKYIVEDLAVKPNDLYDRINKIVTVNNSQESLDTCFELIKDTLLLIPRELDENKYIDFILKDINEIQRGK